VCHKSLCAFFCQKAVLFLSSQGMLSLWPCPTPLRHVYVYLVKKGFAVGVLLFRSDGYVYASRSCPFNKGTSLSRSQYENAVLLLTNLGNLLQLTVKTRYPTATYNHISGFKSVFSRCCLGNCLYMLNIFL